MSNVNVPAYMAGAKTHRATETRVMNFVLVSLVSFWCLCV